MMLALDPADRSSVHELLRHLTATTHEEPVSYIYTLQLYGLLETSDCTLM